MYKFLRSINLLGSCGQFNGRRRFFLPLVPKDMANIGPNRYFCMTHPPPKSTLNESIKTNSRPAACKQKPKNKTRKTFFLNWFFPLELLFKLCYQHFSIFARHIPAQNRILGSRKWIRSFCCTFHIGPLYDAIIWFWISVQSIHMRYTQ